MNKTLTSETNGHQPELQTLEEQILTCGGEMNTEGKLDSTRATLLDILEDRTARILENQRDISAVERVLAILDARQPAGVERAEATDEADSDDEEAEGAEATDNAEGAEAADDAEAAGAKHGDEEAKHEPHGPNASSASILSMPIERLKEIAGDPKAAAVIFLQARGGEPLDCPGCGHRTYTKRVTGQGPRPDIFRCTPCKSEFGIKTGTLMHGSREPLGTWLVAIRLVADSGGEVSGRDLSNLMGTGAKAAADMIKAIQSEMDSPGGLLDAVSRLKQRADTKEEPDTSREEPDTSREAPDPETPSHEAPGAETPSQETPSQETPGQETEPRVPATRVALPSGPITELSLDQMKELSGDSIACSDLFIKARNQDGVDCPRCGIREETRIIGPAKPGQFRCRICKSVYSVRTGTRIEGPTTPLGKWAMAGYLAATGTVPKDEGELALLLGTTRNMARGIMEAAARICPEGQDPIMELVRVTAQGPQDGEAEAGNDTDPTPQDPPQEETQTDHSAQEDDPGASPQDGGGSDGSDAAGQNGSEQDEFLPGADILSPDG